MTKFPEINIVFSSDLKFIPYFATSLYSVLANLRDKRPLNVYLLTDNSFTSALNEQILLMRSVREFNFFPIIVDAGKYNTIKTTVGISVAAYNRLFMDFILPESVERAIYFDSDLIVNKDISAIYDLSLNNLLFRGVEDSISLVYKSRYDLPEKSHHINSGVMLCNIAMMREIDFDDRITEFLDVHRYRVVMGDQQIINEVFHSKIGPLPIQWNVHGSMFAPGWADVRVGVDNAMDVSEVREAVRSPAVVHYTFKRKPWNSLEHPRALDWHRYNGKTPFAVGLPDHSEQIRINGKQQSRSVAGGILKFLDAKVGGYLKSILLLRRTRLELMRISKLLGKGTTRNIKTSRATKPSLDDRTRDALLKNILSEMGRTKIGTEFDAKRFVQSLRGDSAVLCNALQRDLDGGFNENLKTIFRTSNISKDNISNADFAMILVHRVHLPEFWDVINTAYFYELPLVFVEMNFFAAFSTYFDINARPAERRSLGFVIDDMGSYFDARQPSRTELTLNDPAFSLSNEERLRVERLIATIKDRRLTKYNKYVPLDRPILNIEPEAVVVIDQKRGDASIDYARADDTTFERMLASAIEENPERTIYLKAHPDNLHRGASSDNLITHPRVKLLSDEISAPDLLDRCGRVYVVSSQMGFEALLRGKPVVTFGIPFYAGWGLTDDRALIPRRLRIRSIEEIFFVTCIKQSVYIDPNSGALVEMEEMLDLIQAMRERFLITPSKDISAA